MTDVRESPLDPAAVVQPGRTLEQVWHALRATRAPLCVVDAEGGRGAVAEIGIRRALQDGTAPDAPVAPLADTGLVVPSREAAVRRLEADPTVYALAVEDGTRTAVVERALPDWKEAVVMAGGFGTRLRPLTDETPKPLLDVGGKPLLCRILEQLRGVGVERVAVSVHYLADRVKAVVRDGSSFGLEVRYLEEPAPLGTGAGLSLLDRVSGPFFLVNGDILTDVDLRALARHHHMAGNLATVATYRFSAPLPYGVVHHDGDRIRFIEEKPVYRYPVNAGLYAFSPEILDRLEHGRPLAMVDFLNELAGSERIGRFPVVEYWNDVGSHSDYERARREVEEL